MREVMNCETFWRGDPDGYLLITTEYATSGPSNRTSKFVRGAKNRKVLLFDNFAATRVGET